jgi:hypothetical protein
MGHIASPAVPHKLHFAARDGGATNETVTAGVQTLPWHDNSVRTSATGGHYPALISPGLFFWRSTT